ncbi:hypothetical protein [Streptomyces sp. NPDC050564]|uniref:hypothetical protein n=1 Tax=Streptomyces sp. NPDC050564 TaxID=3365631 RepID=UPI003792C4F3
MAEIPEQERQKIMEVIAAALVRLGPWPAPGGWHGAQWFRTRSWVQFCAYENGI